MQMRKVNREKGYLSSSTETLVSVWSYSSYTREKGCQIISYACILISGGTNKSFLRPFAIPSYDFENVANTATNRALLYHTFPKLLGNRE